VEADHALEEAVAGSVIPDTPLPEDSCQYSPEDVGPLKDAVLELNAASGPTLKRVESTIGHLRLKRAKHLASVADSTTAPSPSSVNRAPSSPFNPCASTENHP
jgi:hypothetical protein